MQLPPIPPKRTKSIRYKITVNMIVVNIDFSRFQIIDLILIQTNAADMSMI